MLVCAYNEFDSGFQQNLSVVTHRTNNDVQEDTRGHAAKERTTMLNTDESTQTIM